MGRSSTAKNASARDAASKVARLRRLDHVTRQRHHEIRAMHPGERRVAAARPRRPAARAAPAL